MEDGRRPNCHFVGEHFFSLSFEKIKMKSWVIDSLSIVQINMKQYKIINNLDFLNY